MSMTPLAPLHIEVVGLLPNSNFNFYYKLRNDFYRVVIYIFFLSNVQVLQFFPSLSLKKITDICNRFEMEFYGVLDFPVRIFNITEQFFICLVIICIASLERCTIKSFTQFKTGLFANFPEL